MSKTWCKAQQETNHAAPLDVVPLKPPDMSQNATYSDIYLTVICRMRHIQRYRRMQHEPSQPGSGPPHGEAVGNSPNKSKIHGKHSEKYSCLFSWVVVDVSRHPPTPKGPSAAMTCCMDLRVDSCVDCCVFRPWIFVWILARISLLLGTKAGGYFCVNLCKDFVWIFWVHFLRKYV